LCLRGFTNVSASSAESNKGTNRRIKLISKLKQKQNREKRTVFVGWKPRWQSIC
jgi:ABC-type proline/glycine betaine transport system substrate-binding protein